jgi:hypothetical protein
MPKPPKAQYKQNLRLSRHNERESPTAKAQSTAHNAPKSPTKHEHGTRRTNAPTKAQKAIQRKYKAVRV